MEDEKEVSMQALFMKITHLYFCKGFQILQKTDIHPRQVPLIWQLNKQEGLSQNELSKRLGIKPPTVAVSIKRLERVGIVEKQMDEKDQRKSLIYLTDKGRSLCSDIKSSLEKGEAMLFQNFSETELCLLRRFFIQMIENMEK